MVLPRRDRIPFFGKRAPPCTWSASHHWPLCTMHCLHLLWCAGRIIHRDKPVCGESGMHCNVKVCLTARHAKRLLISSRGRVGPLFPQDLTVACSSLSWIVLDPAGLFAISPVELQAISTLSSQEHRALFWLRDALSLRARWRSLMGTIRRIATSRTISRPSKLQPV